MRVIEGNEMSELRIGDGATVVFHSDRHAGTIINRTPKWIEWQEDNAKLISGKPLVVAGGFVGHFDNFQEYEYKPNLEGVIRRFTLRKNGKWIQMGDSMTGCYLIPGRSKFYDRNF